MLLLRGAQTPGELKQRTERMHAFADLAGVHEALEQLIGRELVWRLDRRPGQKEERYEQLLQGGEEVEARTPGAAPAGEAEQLSTNGDGGAVGAGISASPAQGSPASGTVENPKPEGAELRELRERVERLEREVAELRLAMRHPSPSPLPGPAHDPPRFDPRL